MLLLPFRQLKGVCPFSVNPAFSPRELLLSGYFLFSGLFSVNSGYGSVGQSQ